ncbi:MAG: LmeA family phospholipid-binding protein [Nannocystaceae bacterium]
MARNIWSGDVSKTNVGPATATVSRRAVVLAVVAIVLVQLGIVVGLANADVEHPRWAGTTAEHEINLRLPQAEHVEVQIDGFPVTLGLLTGPRIEGVHVHIDAVEHTGVRATALRLDIEGIQLDRRALLNDRRLAVQSIEWAHVEGALSPDELSAIIGHPVEIHGHALFASVDARRVRLRPQARGRWLELHVEGTDSEPLLYPLPAGATTCKVVAMVTAGRLRLSCAVDHLPEPVRRMLAMG